MPSYEWRRWVKVLDGGMMKRPKDTPVQGYWEYMTTDSWQSPGKEWQRVYSFGVGRVPGAGGSPARTVRRQDGSS